MALHIGPYPLGLRRKTSLMWKISASEVVCRVVWMDASRVDGRMQSQWPPPAQISTNQAVRTHSYSFLARKKFVSERSVEKEKGLSTLVQCHSYLLRYRWVRSNIRPSLCLHQLHQLSPTCLRHCPGSYPQRERRGCRRSRPQSPPQGVWVPLPSRSDRL